MKAAYAVSTASVEFEPEIADPSAFRLYEFPRSGQDVESDEVTSDPAGHATVEKRLRTLFLEGDLDESGRRLRPTDHAYRTAGRLISQAADDLGVDFPVGSASVDSEGGVRITWVRGNREVELACPARTEPAPFIYHEAGSDYDLVEHAGSQALSRLLHWLAD